MFKMLKNFIGKLQNSDETTKKIWLFVLSGISMVIVVSLWVVYLDLTIAKVEAPNNKVLAQVNEEIDNGPGFFAIFAEGAKTIYNEIKERLSVTNKIFIQSPEVNFVAESVNAIAPTKLR